MRVVKLFTIFTCVAILFGCSSGTIEDKPIYQGAKDIKTFVKEDNWGKAKQKAKSIKKLYKDNKWKYQLISDKTTYDNLEQQIELLTVSLEENDKTEAKLHLALIEHYMKSLYYKE
ncbi:DUF4363 family protein [Oceanobacillus sp. Castelsardo]|uniref:DUF4363 family protein n=1 Tax=Oceanobacillus sp. Castelsardo TaxID=1851204 RepID=UPI000838C49B|nr:DUF4363 family protein [Oceanobacillus sp. Castelsardo]